MSKDVINQAIQHKQVIDFYYDDQHRIVEPYAIGKTSKNKLNLLSIQIGGYSSSSKLPDWRMFELAKIKDIKVHKRKFAAYFQVYQAEERTITHALYQTLGTAFEIKPQVINELQNKFNDAMQQVNDQSYWLAKDLRKLFGYTRWSNFAKLMDKAAEHSLGQGIAIKTCQSSLLPAKACLAIAQAADAKKPAVVVARLYFAVQLNQELSCEAEQTKGLERIKAKMQLAEAERYLSAVIYKNNADSKTLGRIRSIGDSKLFGGLNTARLKEKIGAKRHQVLSDFLPDILLKAKEFAAALTSYNVQTYNINDQYAIGRSHSNNNNFIRQVLLKNNIVPENMLLLKAPVIVAKEAITE